MRSKSYISFVSFSNIFSVVHHMMNLSNQVMSQTIYRNSGDALHFFTVVMHNVHGTIGQTHSPDQVYFRAKGIAPVIKYVQWLGM